MAEDEWDRDPRVLSMRRVFAAIERRQGELLHQMNVHWMDRSLRTIRKTALNLFERTWAGAADRGVRLGEEDAVDLYILCLARVLQTRGFSMPSESLTCNEAVRKLMEEAR